MPKGRVIIDGERCKECGLCVNACPFGVLRISQRINSRGFHPVEDVFPDKCTGCRLCATMCPNVVITVERAP